MARPLSVIIYTQEDCPFCEKAKSVLENLKVQPEERPVSNPRWRKELLAKNRDMVLPTIIVNKEVLIRPGEDRLRATINFELHR